MDGAHQIGVERLVALAEHEHERPQRTQIYQRESVGISGGHQRPHAFAASFDIRTKGNFAMTDNTNAHTTDTPKEPNPKLKELTERLTGNWRVKGPEINGEAEYEPVKGGSVLVANVSVVSGGTRIKLIQHIGYDQDTDTLRAHYMDTRGNEATYTWVLDGQKLRVSLGDKDSDTYFEATLNDDNSEYIGTWHYPDGGDDDATAERIEYKRIK